MYMVITGPATLSIALPGSILDNAQSPELRTYLAGQVYGLLSFTSYRCYYSWIRHKEILIYPSL